MINTVFFCSMLIKIQIISGVGSMRGPLIGKTCIPPRTTLEKKMAAYSSKIKESRDRFFLEYNQQHPLTPLHYIVDLGSNAFMQTIIISVQIQYIDFNTTGFQRRNYTDNLYTIEAMTEEQFIHHLYSISMKNETELKQNIKKLMCELDKEWLKTHTKSVRKAQKESTASESKDDNDKNKNKNKNIENEPKNIDNESNEKKQDDVENIDIELSVDPNIENVSDEEEQNIENDSDNTDNEEEDDDYKLAEIDCVKNTKKILIHPGTETQNVDEGKLILTEDYQQQLKKLQEICEDYSFDHLSKDNNFAFGSDEDQDYNFEFNKMDQFNHKNWTLWKFLDINGNVVRRFAAKQTAEQVRMCTAKSMQKNSMQTEVWAFDNRDAIKKEAEVKSEIENTNVKKKIIITSDEDRMKSKRRKLRRNKWKPLDDADDKNKNKNKKKTKKGIEIVEINYDNTFAHLVTSDAGLYA